MSFVLRVSCSNVCNVCVFLLFYFPKESLPKTLSFVLMMMADGFRVSVTVSVSITISVTISVAIPISISVTVGGCKAGAIEYDGHVLQRVVLIEALYFGQLAAVDVTGADDEDGHVGHTVDDLGVGDAA